MAHFEYDAASVLYSHVVQPLYDVRVFEMPVDLNFLGIVDLPWRHLQEQSGSV